MQSIYNFLKTTFKAWVSVPYQENKIFSGPNTLEELLTQFDLPVKIKTQADVIRDYQVKETLAALEIDMLRMDPARAFKGVQIWLDNYGNKFVDWVPCVVRPEVIYCSYGKN